MPHARADRGPALPSRLPYVEDCIDMYGNIGKPVDVDYLAVICSTCNPPRSEAMRKPVPDEEVDASTAVNLPNVEPKSLAHLPNL
ncbi:hypothetical protein AWB78_08350 [Caballeronia calidae]|uniref:Uncharacterized protein n=1 Tax=Caballeronia calidae TaxID=1777139 RepID=A0A158EM25_9BURK|nr:hypothetical protein AWB78_08350 [Caballeronia calidae]